MSSPPPEITFRPLTDADLPLFHRWLNEPGVVAWWEGRDVSWDAVVRDYGESPQLEGSHDRIHEYWLALRDGDPVGWIQCYRAWDAVDGETYHWRKHLDLMTTAGIDYLLGEATQRGRGIGPAMIRAFVRDVVFPNHPDWERAAAGPFAANAASVRALEKAGFRRVATLEDSDGPCALMVIERAAVEQGSEG